jgi:hypothetical protein
MYGFWAFFSMLCRHMNQSTSFNLCTTFEGETAIPGQSQWVAPAVRRITGNKCQIHRKILAEKKQCKSIQENHGKIHGNTME